MSEIKGLGTCSICGKPLVKGEGIGATCKAHQGKLRQTAEEVAVAPEGWLRMSAVCRKAVEQGITISQVVNASGGDACTKPLLDPIFKVKYVGRGKWMNPEVVTKGFALLKQLKEASKDAPVTKELKQEVAVSGQLKQSVVK
jgi:hypothetical protein